MRRTEINLKIKEKLTLFIHPCHGNLPEYSLLY